MKTLKPFSFKTALSAGLALTLIGATAGCAVAGSGYDNYPIYNDNSGYSNAENNRAIQQLRKDLRRQGYQVMDIRSDSNRGNRVLTAFAKKNNQAYELKYTSPDLRLISSNKKAWSNIWQDKNNGYNGKHHNSGKYNNNNRYKNDDVEDRIKKEARYPAIKQRAIRKVEGMGYRVKDIELEEKNNRGVFEIEAKRGSQEYDILLGYPNLNVIKIEKD
ncbi:PepSY domain-containing protein [Psychrobacter sp. DAB_AL32B]|uniref:PepSY domain-containing protein n=1 Tax=Psychrobacter sp. DAB_AL32B TaxID=1028414 RepID=UPI000B7E91CD|nr:hypothetical protein [Psychrobacter sp. DAB_AL32B]OXL19718.1 hypothetical protein CAN34_10860 [Psychrobacter sp. DAB_AL32B]